MCHRSALATQGPTPNQSITPEFGKLPIILQKTKLFAPPIKYPITSYSDLQPIPRPFIYSLFSS